MMYEIPLTIEDARRMVVDPIRHPLQSIEARGFIHGHDGEMIGGPDVRLNWKEWLAYNAGWRIGKDKKNPPIIDMRLAHLEQLARDAAAIDLDALKVRDDLPSWRDVEREIEKVAALVKRIQELAARP